MRIVRCLLSKMDIRLQVPWGNVSGVHWPGSGDNVLAVHGWLDNANSFAPLMSPKTAPIHTVQQEGEAEGEGAGKTTADPSTCHQQQHHQDEEKHAALLRDLNVVAIDLPGHGRSSHKFSGFCYQMVDWVRDVYVVVKQLGWKRFHLVGHSMGASICLLFSATFPEKVSTLTLLEGAVPLQSDDAAVCDSLRQSILSWEALELKKQATSLVTFDEAVEKLMQANLHLDMASAKLLLERGLVPADPSEADPSAAPTRYHFARDLSLRQGSALRLNFEQVEAFMRGVKCPVCFVLAEDGVKYQMDSSRKHIQTLAQHSPMFQMHRVAGGHHVHMTHADTIRPLWLDFLQEARRRHGEKAKL
eukprot:m.37955 g.37955  ORF g.37955 m.37955 type:complete len:359 (-) comp11443_c0_seq1:34-1110(-)